MPQREEATVPDRRPAALNVHLQQLAYLREIDRSPTWARAAQRLNLSQPALSQSMAELERRLGVSLFERDGRRRRLTDEGHETVRFAREVLARAEEFSEALHRRREGRAGALRVGMIDAGSLYLLPQAVRRFRDEYPDVDLRLTVAPSSSLERALLRFELDLAVVVDDGDPPDDVLRETLTEEPLYLYAPPRRREDPAEADWVLYPPGSHTRERIDVGLHERGITPRVRLESGNPQVLRQMVALGFGWSVLPAAVAESGPESLRRRRGGPVAVRTICTVRRRNAPADPRAESFLAMARDLR